MGAGLAGDALGEARVGDVLDKDRPNLMRPDRVDDLRDVAGADVSLRRHALRRDELDAVARGEIAEGVMGRDDAATLLGNGGDRLLDFRVERVELGEIGVGVGLIGLGALRIDGRQRFPDRLDINFGVGDVLPSVRILSLFVLSRSDAFAQGEHLALAFGGSDETVEPAFKSEPVDENEPRLRDAAAVGRTGLVDMGVAVGPDDGGDGHPVAADLPHKIADNRKAGDDGNFLRLAPSLARRMRRMKARARCGV